MDGKTQYNKHEKLLIISLVYFNAIPIKISGRFWGGGLGKFIKKITWIYKDLCLTIYDNFEKVKGKGKRLPSQVTFLVRYTRKQ